MNIKKLIKPTVSIITIWLMFVFFKWIISKYVFSDSFWLSLLAMFFLLIIGLKTKIFIQKIKKKPITWEKITLWVLIFVFITQSILTVAVSSSEAYNFSKSYIKNNPSITQELGSIYDMTLLPFGSINTSKKFKEENKRASLNFIVKGERNTKLVSISIQKTHLDNDWVIVNFN